MSNREYALVRRQIIRAAARRANVPVEAASFVVDELFEQIRLHVAFGRVVSFPQIGAIGPYVRKVRGRKGEGSSVRCTPRFSACRSFRAQVRLNCPPNTAGKRKLRRHSINNAPSAKAGPTPVMVDQAIQAHRDSITRQLLAAQRERSAGRG